MTRVGIAGIGTYLPQRRLDAAMLAERTGMSEKVVRERYGLTGVHVAEDEHVSDMAIHAGRAALDEAGVAPEEIRSVIYFGSTWKDYAVWQAAPRIAYELGCTQSFALELDYVSCGAPVALRVCKALLVAEPHVGPVLAVGASRESGLVDYQDRWSQFMFTYGDGAVGAVLSAQADPPEVELLGSGVITDGRFANDSLVPAGGSVERPSHESVDGGRHRLMVVDPASMAGLMVLTLKNMVQVSEIAASNSGLDLADVDFVCAFHLKRSAHRALMQALNLDEERSEYLSDTGHMSGVDTLFALDRAARAGRLRSGDHVLLVASGTGCSWAASIIRWGHPPG